MLHSNALQVVLHGSTSQNLLGIPPWRLGEESSPAGMRDSSFGKSIIEPIPKGEISWLRRIGLLDDILIKIVESPMPHNLRPHSASRLALIWHDRPMHPTGQSRLDT